MAFAPLPLHETEKGSGAGMISKLLIIADASKEALDSVLDAFHTIQKGQPRVTGFFISCLSEPFLNHLGPNILTILLKEETEALKTAEDCFTHMDIPHHFEVISARHWQTAVEEVKLGGHDLIILQGEFLNICREKSLIEESCLHSVTPKCPILFIYESEKPSSRVFFENRE